MSDEEQDAAIARLVRQRSEAKKRKALLENELRTAGRSLWEIGGSLKDVNTSGFNNSVANLIPQIAKAPDICGLDRIKAMLEELERLYRLIEELNRGAKELGIFD
jgi:hypothetical protein